MIWYTKKYCNSTIVSHYRNNYSDFCKEFAVWILLELISEKKLYIPCYDDFCKYYDKNCKILFDDFFSIDEDGMLTDYEMKNIEKEVGSDLWCGKCDYIERFWLLLEEFMRLYYLDIKFFNNLSMLISPLDDNGERNLRFRQFEYYGNLYA